MLTNNEGSENERTKSMVRRFHRASVHSTDVQQVESILKEIQNESQIHDGAYSLKFTVNPEWWRLFAYSMFWLMCILAIVFTQTLVKPYLANGPEDGSACGPFNRNDADFGVLPGEGFDLETQSHLMQRFGFNNICVNWDYSPSRELTAMFYPLFEYSLIIYLCLDFLATSVAMKRGEIQKEFWQFSRVLFPICIFLVSQVRMIFVCVGYESAQLHTAGFLGLQWALVLVAFHNAGFVWNSNIAYGQLGGPRGGLRNTHIAITVYIICQVAISIAKLYSTFYIVIYGYAVSWTLRPVGSRVAGQVVDWIWMVFNAVIPMAIAFFRYKNETPLEIAVWQETLYVLN